LVVADAGPPNFDRDPNRLHEPSSTSCYSAEQVLEARQQAIWCSVPGFIEPQTAHNAMRGSRREDLALHPTVKPTGLVADAIQDVTRRGDLVLDLFLGSGTTLMAAERTGRRFRGLDIDPAHVDVAIERWSARTGLPSARSISAFFSCLKSPSAPVRSSGFS
jgi:DNA methylase